MRSSRQLTANSTIGLLPTSTYYKLCRQLNVDQAWQRLLEHIPNRRRDGCRFSIDDANQFERDKDPTHAVLSAWKCDNVTIQDLIDVLEKCQLLREKDIVLGLIAPSDDNPPQNMITTPPPVVSPVSEDIPVTAPLNASVTSFKYSVLATCTNNFDTRSTQSGGCLIGRGGSAEVFRGYHRDTGEYLAVKRLKDTVGGASSRPNSARAQFDNEVEILSKLESHMNLISFLGVSTDGAAVCLVCEYMSGGSLQDRLSSQEYSGALRPSRRVSISQDVARALAHLHSHNLIHRDVKSANILLDEHGTAKLGDYGIARIGPRHAEHTSTVNIIGTTVYMPLEYIRDGELSFLTDSYSFGVVLLELLTGLPAFDSSREQCSLVSHVEDNYDSIHEVIDRRVADWDRASVDAIYSLTDKLLSDKRSRPSISSVLTEIEDWI